MILLSGVGVCVCVCVLILASYPCSVCVTGVDVPWKMIVQTMIYFVWLVKPSLNIYLHCKCFVLFRVGALVAVA
jgi:hypothetical protein